ncbi:MAG: protein-export chaperone SecB [Chloracidobacterium sp.]|nr:protein-export chaperone SecB [Chloracidobacterium sp.]
MPATLSRLQLKRYFLKELSYFLKDSLEKEPSAKDHAKTIDLEIGDMTTPVGRSGREWRCELTIKSTNPEPEHFYDFRIVMVGFFSIHESVDTKTAKIIAETNAPAILYSTSREIVATVTRRSPYPGTLLPAVTFLRESEEPKQPSKRQPTPKTR